MTKENFLVIFQNRQGKFKIFEKKIAREAASTLIALNEAGLWGFIIEYNSGRVIARTAEEV